MTRARYAEEIARALPLWAQTAAAWGKDDCALALADIDIAVQGIDPAAPYRGRYRTEKGAQRVLGKAGLLGGWGRAARRFKWPRITPDAALDGDRGVAVTPAGVTSVIRYCGRWFARSDRGNLMVLDTKVMRAWRVL